MNPSILRKHVQPALLAALATVILATTPGVSFAVGLTDIAPAPIASTRTATVKSNITLLMDTSNSMAWTHMPDEMEGTSLIPPNTMPAGVGYRSSACNALYYDPSRAYALPVDSTGAKLATPSFTSAAYNYFSTNTETRDLSLQFQAYDHNTRRKTNPSGSDPAQTTNGISFLANEDTPQAAYYWVYTGSEPLAYNSAACTQPLIGTATTISTAGGGTWTKKLVTSSSGTLIVKNSSNQDVLVTDERANFAIWYTYYRTRMALTKSSIGLAFAPVSDQYRVGFVTMNPGSPVASTKYEALGDFDSSKRASWYSKLYGQTAEGSSPAREALARVGRMYASKVDGINQGMVDPNPQNYTCQQNFTIMTTDGYWNTAAETVGPVGLDGTTWVGQQDGTLTGASGDTPRPIWDGALGGSKITTDISNLYSYATCSTGLYGKSTTKATAVTTAVNRSTVTTNQSTFQRVKTQYQTAQTTTQVVRSSDQVQQRKSYVTANTSQWTDSTNQNLQTDQYNLEVKTQPQRSTWQTGKVVTSTARTATVVYKRTFERQATTYTTAQTKTVVTRTSAQTLKSTYIRVATPYKTNKTVTTTDKSTQQWQRTQTQKRITTTQIFQYNGTTEQTTAVPSCNPGGNISCATEVNGPTLVASCTNGTTPADASNNYLKTECVATVTGPTYVETCSYSAANSGNSYTLTDCNPNSTGPTAVDPSSCVNQTALAGNNWLTINCVSTPVVTNGVDVTTAACPTGTSASTPGTWTATNASHVQTTCTTATSGAAYNADPAICTGTIAATSANGWTTTTCADNNSLNKNVDATTCTVANTPASSGNSWTRTTCTASGSNVTDAVIDPATAATAGICPSGTNVTPSSTQTYNQSPSGPSWQTLSCKVTVTKTDPVDFTAAGCPSGSNAYAAGTWTAAAATPSWTRNVCVTTLKTAATTVQPSTCTPATIAGTSGNGYVNTVCSDKNTAAPGTAVAPSSCTIADDPATSTNSWIRTTCATTASGTQGNIDPSLVASTCPSGSSNSANGTWNQAPTSGNGQVTSSCTTLVTTTNPTDASSGCPSGTVANAAGTWTTAAASGNSWTKTVCTTTRQSGPTGVDPATCSNIAANSGNSWTTTTCGVVTISSLRVQTCGGNVAGNSGNGWVSTTCTPTTVGPTPVLTCTPAPTATLANNWTVTTCPTPNKTGPTPLAQASCGNVTATLANNWISHTCAEVTGSNVVNSCTDTAASSTTTPPWTKTTCVTTVTQPYTPVDPATCTASIPASDGNSHITTDCNTVHPGNQGAIDVSTIGSVCPSGTVSTATGTWTQPALSTTSPAWTRSTCSTTVNAGVLVNPTAGACPSGTVGFTVGSWVGAGTSPNWINNVCTTTLYSAAQGVDPTTCTANVTPAAGNSFVATACTNNNVAAHAVDPTTCTVPNTPAGSGNNWVRTVCAISNTGPTPWNPASCPDGTTAATSPSWVQVTCATSVSLPTPVPPTCQDAVADSSNNWTSNACTFVNTGPDQVSSCSPISPVAGNDYMATTCTPVPGSKLQFTPTRTTTTDVTSGAQVVSTSQVVATGSATDANGICLVTASAPALPSPNPRRPLSTELPAPNVAGCTAWPCTQTFVSITGGSKNSLADVAQYYYVTDLRPDLANEVSQPGQGPEDDRKTSQHMTTFAMGLGVSGTLTYNENYRSAPTGDIADIRNGVKTNGQPANWPVWPSPDTTLFPQASNGNYVDQLLYNDPRSIDDFWHAAINGRGQYFSAKDPDTVVTSIKKALDAIKNASGSGTGAASSTLTPTVGDNISYIAGYTTQVWTGNVTAYTVSTTNAQITGDPVWDAASKLNVMVGDACDNRNILMMGAGTLSTFSWNTKACDSALNPTGTAFTGLTATQKAYFNTAAIEGLTQYNPITDGNSGSTAQKTNAPGENLVNFLRGQKQYEGFVPNNTKLYRSRDSRLGDIVNSQPTYVPEPNLSYQENDYATFKSTNSTRIPMLYVGGNDGMLHAFYAPKSGDTTRAAMGGKEAWAVVPTSVLPNLYKLADYQYEAKHTWFVDGTPTVGDMFDTTANAWKTMLVGSLGGGGKSFFALDVTDPTTPKGMWEFTQGSICYDANNAATAGSDCHIGYTFGRPILTKYVKDDGTTQWVVLVTSGYNNVRSPSGPGDGVGYLYILDAVTGKILYKISTGEGDATTPSGLRELNIYVTNYVANNTAQRAYGTDLLGNVWRFDINNTFDPAGREAIKVGQAFDGTTPTPKQQPITTRPLLTEFSGKTIITIGTGRMVGITDLTDDSVQSLYTFQDPLSSTTAYASFRTALKPLQFTQSLDTNGNRIRTIACTGTDVQCASPIGWYVDLPDARERVNIDPLSIGSTLEVITNVPQSTDCNPRGYSWINEFDLITGKTIDGTTSRYIDSLSAGFGALCVGDACYAQVVKTDSGVVNYDIHRETPPPTGKRVSWREILK